MFNLFKNKKQEGISITAPCSGRIIPISEVNDPIFSKKYLEKDLQLFPKVTKYMLLWLDELKLFFQQSMQLV